MLSIFNCFFPSVIFMHMQLAIILSLSFDFYDLILMKAFAHLLLATMAGFFPLGQLALIGGALLPYFRVPWCFRHSWCHEVEVMRLPSHMQHADQRSV